MCGREGEDVRRKGEDVWKGRRGCERRGGEDVRKGKGRRGCERRKGEDVRKGKGRM